MRFTEKIVIGRSPSAVWDVLTDFEKYPLWTGNREKITIKSKGVTKEGLRYQQLGLYSGRPYLIDNKVTEWVDEKRLTVYTASPFGKGYIHYEIDKTPEGTLVILSSEIFPVGPLKNVPKAVYDHLRGSMKYLLERLKIYLEKWSER